jgi:hypothetical protein
MGKPNKPDSGTADSRRLDYAAPPVPVKRLNIVIRVLVGILAAVCVSPTVDILGGHVNYSGPVSDTIGIIVTLSIAFVLASISFTGRLLFWRGNRPG